MDITDLSIIGGYQMKFKLIIMFVAVVLILTGCGEKYVPTDAIRLHVVANSDNKSDQQVKLKVRDAIVKDCSMLFEDSKSSDESYEIVKFNSEKIKQIANNTLLNSGYSYEAQIETGKFRFPDRLYETTAFPAGEYRALKVVLGNGEGKNWWCVLYPPLCVVSKEQIDDEDTQIDESEEIVFESYILEKLFGKDTPQPGDEAISRLKKLFKKANWS